MTTGPEGPERMKIDVALALAKATSFSVWHIWLIVFAPVVTGKGGRHEGRYRRASGVSVSLDGTRRLGEQALASIGVGRKANAQPLNISPSYRELRDNDVVTDAADVCWSRRLRHPSSNRAERQARWPRAPSEEAPPHNAHNGTGASQAICLGKPGLQFNNRSLSAVQPAKAHLGFINRLRPDNTPSAI